MNDIENDNASSQQPQPVQKNNLSQDSKISEEIKIPIINGLELSVANI
jgi:hypothetical protein